jgi:methylated-DNA-[protein]-cysteine S-methyltransferase
MAGGQRKLSPRPFFRRGNSLREREDLVVRSASMGVMLATAVVETPIGVLRLAVTQAGVARIGLPRSSGPGFAGWLRTTFADAERAPWLPLVDKLSQELGEYFAGRRREFSLPLDLRGTEFQRAVWREIAAIPYGETRTYGEIAAAAGNPRAVRAAGTATGNNPVPILIPCHRVIAAKGRLGGFSGGLDAKRRLLALERASTGELL